MVPDARGWPLRLLPLLLIVAFAALPLVFATVSTTVAVAYSSAIVAFVAGMLVGERTVRPDEVERRQRLELRRRLREDVLRADPEGSGGSDASAPSRPRRG